MSKSQLNQYCQKSRIDLPKYNTTKAGDLFVSEVTVNDVPYRSLEGHSSKKEAESDAAGVAIRTLAQLDPSMSTVEELLAKVEGESSKKQRRQVVAQQAGQQPPSGKTRADGKKQVSSSVAMPLPSIAPQVVMSSPPLTLPGPEPRPSPAMVPATIGIHPTPSPSVVKSGVQTHGAVSPPPGIQQAIRPPSAIPLSLPPHPLMTTSLPPHLLMMTSSHGSPAGAVRMAMPHNPMLPGMPVPLSTLPAMPPGPAPIPPRPQGLGGADGRTPQPVSMGIGGGHVLVSSGSPSPYHPVLPPPGLRPDHTHQPPRLPPEDVVKHFEVELERLCQSRAVAPPTYSVKEKSGRFRAWVEVQGVTYSTSKDYESFDIARESATLTALACIGLQAMGMADGGAAVPLTSSPAAVKQQQQSVFQSRSSPQPQPPATPPPSQKGAETLPQTEAKDRPPVSATPPTLPLQTPAFFSTSNSTSNTPTTSPATGKMSTTTNFKVALNTYCQKRGLAVPLYECTYPEDAVGYIAKVRVQGQVFSSGTEGTKRGAESKAAAMALESFGVSIDEQVGGALNGSAPGGGGSLDNPSSVPAAERNISYKNLLQESLQKSSVSELPRYSTERIQEGFVCTVAVRVGPDNTQRFTGRAYGNKKAAEQDSARMACYELKIVT